MQFFGKDRKRGLTGTCLPSASTKKDRNCMSYTQSSLKERYHISACRKLGYKQKEIALELGVSLSTISWELRRNQDMQGHYDPKKAQIETRLHHRHKYKHTVIILSIEHNIRSKLRVQYPAKQVAGRMRRECLP